MMQVILLEKVRNLGDLGATVNVKSGYSRNYLIPQGKAVFANDKNIELFETRRAEFEKKAVERLSESEAKAAKLRALNVLFDVLSSDEGKLYGSIGPTEVANMITALGVPVTKNEVIMPLGPIHVVGEHNVDIQLPSDVSLTLSLQVGKPEDIKATPEPESEEDE